MNKITPLWAVTGLAAVVFFSTLITQTILRRVDLAKQKEPQHTHTWSNWSNGQQYYNGFYQFRNCTVCGFAEKREIK